MRFALGLAAAFASAAFSTAPATVQAGCTVNVGRCTGGDCLINYGTCAEGGRCTVTIGYCGSGRSDLVAL
jgi:hypothetical protein